MVYFVKYFKHYLLGRRFTVRTDHAALQWLRKVPEPVGQQARWIGFLEEFEYDIVHRPGKQHANADALSRRPCRSGCCTAVSASVVEQAEGTRATVSDGYLWASATDAAPPCAEAEGPASLEVSTPVPAVDATAGEPTHALDELIWSKEELQAAQLADSDIKVVVAWVSDGTEKPPWEQVAVQSGTTKALWHQRSRLCLREGILYRKFYSTDGLSTSLQLVTTIRYRYGTPYRYRMEFIRLAHEDMTGGHLGRKRTEAQVQRTGYWSGWSEDVRRFLRTYQPCVQYHRGPPPRLAQLKPMLVGEPLREFP